MEKNKDNILPRIMAVSGSYDKLFAEELKKYDPLKVCGSSPDACPGLALLHAVPRTACLWAHTSWNPSLQPGLPPAA